MSEENKSYIEKFDDSTRLFSKEFDDAHDAFNFVVVKWLLITMVVWCPLILWMASGDDVAISDGRDFIRYVAWKIGFPIEL